MPKSSIAYAIATLCLIACAISTDWLGCSSGQVLETPHWSLNGNPAPSSTTLKTLIDSIIPAHSEEVPGYYKCASKEQWRVDTVGKWYGRVVIDIFNDVRCPGLGEGEDTFTYIARKAIAVQTAGDKFRLIYLSWSDPGNVYYESSKLVSLEREQVLYTKSQMSGTGHFFDERYWGWDKTKHMPRILDMHRAIGEALGHVLPAGHGIWKGGGFNINTLSFESYTWRDGDGNCCPSGGKVRATFHIISGQLAVKKAVFDYGDLEERALSIAKHSADSLYLKRAPEIYTEESATTTAKKPQWMYLNSFERQYEPSPEAATLDTLIGRYVKFVISPIIYCNLEKTPIHWEVDTIGVVHGHPLAKILYTVDCPMPAGTKGKVIAVEIRPSLFRLIYVEYTFYSEPAYDNDTVLTIGNDVLIAVRKNGNDRELGDAEYWLWDSDADMPVCLYPGWVLNETLNRIAPERLPKGLAARPHLGSWDFSTLSYETYTWLNTDDDDRPSGGKLTIQFGIKDQRLVPLEFSYNPADISSTKDQNQ